MVSTIKGEATEKADETDQSNFRVEPVSIELDKKFDEEYVAQPQWWSKLDDLVISGIAGRYPDASNVKEFMENLFSGIDMITEDNRRWDPGFYDLPKRHGKLKDLSKFDASFFGMSQEQATVNDPQLNLLLETSYEAMFDAGLDPMSLKGSKTGVYVGNSPLEIASILLHDWEKVNKYTVTGTSRTMLANQLSYAYNFTGPSMVLDTACSSAMLALQMAVDAIRKGECDSAIVAGAHLTLIPTSAVMFLKLGMLGQKGMCQTFDAKGDGYVRSECVGCIFVQKASTARRCYATIVHAKSNTDGYKEQGITFPSAEQQAALLKETYKEGSVNPYDVVYVEAHGTGTKVGDVVEGSAITAVLARNRQTPLLIGSVKSNAGHAESASAILSLTKAIISMETGIIPKNLHYSEPNMYIPSLTDGRLKVVSENLPWKPDTIGINSFGFGGSNTHIILRPNNKIKRSVSFKDNENNVPTLLIYSGRTENGIKNIFSLFSKHSDDLYLHNILLEQSNTQPRLFPYRGFALYDKTNNELIENEISHLESYKKPSVYLAYCSWESFTPSLTNELSQIKVFRESVEKCVSILHKVNIIYTDKAATAFVNEIMCQVALTDLLHFLGLKQTGVIGESTGELLAQYACGLIDLELTMIIASYMAKKLFIDKDNHNNQTDIRWNDTISALPTDVKRKFSSLPNHYIQLSGGGDDLKNIRSISTNYVIIQVTPGRLRFNKNPTFNSVSILLNESQSGLNKFASNLGRLYMNGVNMQIQKLYPDVDYPVPRGTPMLSSFFDWDHTQTWNIYTAAQQSLNCVCTFVVDPFVPKSKDMYLLDHVIDGHVIYPFTGYLVLAWRAICKIKMIDYNKTPVILENVKVLRATVMNKSVKFVVSVTLANGLFEITEEDNLVATGTVKIVDPTNRTPFYYENLHKYPLRLGADDEKIELSVSDMYKEYRMRGYEYGPSFRGIYKACNSGELATLLWTGNWVTFIDTLLQTNLVLEKAYTMRVPIRLDYLRIDPTRHAAASYDIDGINVVDARNNVQTFGAISGGVETYGLVCQTLPIRSPQNQKVTFEWGKFAPYIDEQCLAEFVEIKSKLHKSNEVCRQLALTIVTKLLNNYPNILENNETFKQIVRNTKAELLNDVLSDVLQDKHNTLPIFFSEFLKDISVKPSSGDSSEILIREKVNSFIQSTENDPLLQFTWNHPVGINLLDICLQNKPGHYYKIAAVEPRNLTVMKTIKYFTLTHPLAEGDWLLVGSKVDKFTDVQKKSIGVEVYDVDLDSEEELSEIYKNQDIILLDRVLHTKLDIVKYLTRIGQLLDCNGFIIVSEITSNFETALLMETLENNLESTRLTANGTRKYGLFYEHCDWLKIFEKAGYYTIGYRGDDLMTSAYILRKIKSVSLNPHFVYVNELKEFSWIENVQKALEARINDPPENTIVLFTNELRDCGLGGIAQSFREEYGKKNRIRVCNDISLKVRDGTPVIDVNDKTVLEQLKYDLLINSYRDGKWGTGCRFLFAEEELNSSEKTEHAFINTTVPGDLSSLAWVSSANKFFEYRLNKPADQHLASVYYAALNFRDIMVASGRLAADFIPNVEGIDPDCLLGIEFVGRSNATGKRVMGISLIAQALATTVIYEDKFVWNVPEHWSMEEAASVPIAYSTVYYALIVRGEMRKGESVLIHSGTGGVGIAAITVALAYGCEVFTTCSSEDKKQFLLKRFPKLDAKHISSSRNTDFELHVLQATGGRGVDLVLNSLSEALLQSSVHCLAKNGRFLEIGKFDLAMNSTLQLEFFQRNAEFHGIVMDSLSFPLNEGWEKAALMLQTDIVTGIVVPLPTTVYNMNKPEEAFRFMAQGKHIGKVLLQIRQEESERVVFPKPVEINAHRRTQCHPQHVYILVGGLGGIGLELSQWLINRGAKKIILTSRSGAKTGYQKRCLCSWRKAGVAVIVSNLNVVSLDETYKLIKEAQTVGPIGGIFNLSMVLKDTLFENQSIQNFQETCFPKYDGTRHLDIVSRELCKDELKWFVYFSSLVSGRGNAGQTAYAFANCSCESIIEQRCNDNLPGVSIQWGAIADVGAIIDTVSDNKRVIAGSFPQRIASCMHALDFFLSVSNKTTVNSFVKAEIKSNSSSLDEDVVDTIARILGITDASQLNQEALLIDLGLDSLMGVEIKQILERNYEMNLSMKDIRTLTLAKLRTMAKSAKVAKSADVTTLSDTDKAGSNTELITDNMFHIKFQINFGDLVPESPCIKIKSVENKGNIFFVHPIDGLANNFIPISKELNYNVYCFQLSEEAPRDTAENLATFYIKQMKAIQTVGPYQIVGYSFGAVIAFEMALQLQQEATDSIQSLVLLDATHTIMKHYFIAYRRYHKLEQENEVNQSLFESELLCRLLLNFVIIDYTVTLKQLIAAKTLRERVDTTIDILFSNGYNLNDRAVSTYGVEAYLKKVLMLEKYNAGKKFVGDVLLIRSFNELNPKTEVNKDFGLNQSITGKVQVCFVEGDHDTFIQNNGAKECAKLISESMLK